MEVQILPAYNGDSIILNFSNEGNQKNILIDGGIARTYPQILKERLKGILDNSQAIDLLITTHIDDDHIGGIIEIFRDNKTILGMFKSIWFNSGDTISQYFKTNTDEKRELNILMNNNTNMSYAQGITLESVLKKTRTWNKELIFNENKYEFFNSTIYILSPDLITLKQLNNKWEVEKNKKVNMSESARNYHISIRDLMEDGFVEDKSIPNKSSISFLIKQGGFNILMLADSHPSTIVDSLTKLGYSKENPLNVDLIKISHHGSKFNTSNDLLKMIKCNKYVFSTDGTNYNFPHKEVFAKILKYESNPVFYFNYKNRNTTSIFNDQDKKQFSFTSIYLEDQNYTIKL